MNRQAIILAAGGMMLLSLGGWLIHVRLHPPAATPFNWIPFVFGLISTVVVPVLFCFRRMVPWAYVLNVAAVVVGTVTMAYFSITTWALPVTVWYVVAYSTFPDIVVLAAKLCWGHTILRLHFPKPAPEAAP